MILQSPHPMTKAKNKTQPTKTSATSFINALEDDGVRKNAKMLLKAFKEATGVKPVMWGNIIGFGSYHYKYESGREGDMLATGFALRKSGPTVYIMPGYHDYSKIINELGVKYKLGKSCLYLKNLEDLNTVALKKLINAGLRDLKKIYPVILK